MCEEIRDLELTAEQAKSLRAALRRESVYFIPFCPCPPSMFSVITSIEVTEK